MTIAGEGIRLELEEARNSRSREMTTRTLGRATSDIRSLKQQLETIQEAGLEEKLAELRQQQEAADKKVASLQADLCALRVQLNKAQAQVPPRYPIETVAAPCGEQEAVQQLPLCDDEDAMEGVEAPVSVASPRIGDAATTAQAELLWKIVERGDVAELHHILRTVSDEAVALCDGEGLNVLHKCARSSHPARRQMAALLLAHVNAIP